MRDKKGQVSISVRERRRLNVLVHTSCCSRPTTTVHSTTHSFWNQPTAIFDRCLGFVKTNSIFPLFHSWSLTCFHGIHTSTAHTPHCFFIPLLRCICCGLVWQWSQGWMDGCLWCLSFWWTNQKCICIQLQGLKRGDWQTSLMREEKFSYFLPLSSPQDQSLLLETAKNLKRFCLLASPVKTSDYDDQLSLSQLERLRMRRKLDESDLVWWK